MYENEDAISIDLRDFWPKVYCETGNQKPVLGWTNLRADEHICEEKLFNWSKKKI